MATTFLEDQVGAISVWRLGSQKPLVLAGVGSELHLFSEELDVIETTKPTECGGKIIRLVGLSNNSSFFFSTQKGFLGFLSLVGSAASLGKVELCSHREGAAIDADIHRSGHLSCVLSKDFLALIDMQRDSLMGSIPLGKTGTASGVRIVENSTLAVSSSIVSLFDVRTSECKSGIPNIVMEGGNPGRVFTTLESDHGYSILAGDSSGGVWQWDSRQPSSPVKSMHAHAGAVLSVSVAGSLVGSGAADGTVSIWRDDNGNQTRRKTRKILIAETTGGAGDLKRIAVSGTPTAISVEASSTSDQRIVYATDTGVLGVSSLSDFTRL